MRDPQTLEPYGPDAQPELLLGRGYTGHEHLPWFGLVNMNARLYDPAVGRFLSPDPLIQAPDNTQNYNRYSYCLNNPMKYVDLSGLMAYKTYSPIEIARALDILGKGYSIDAVIGGVGGGGWNSSAWEVVNEWDVYVDYIYLNSFTPANGRRYSDGTYILTEVTVNVWRFPKIKPIDYSMSIMQGHDSGIQSPGLTSAVLGLVKNELDKSKITYKIINNNGYANIIVRNNNKLSKSGRYSVTNSVKGFAKPISFIAAGFTIYDIIETALDGHVEVACVKGLVAGTEYLVTAYVPGGVILVLGFEMLDYNIHLTDGLYKYIDSSY